MDKRTVNRKIPKRCTGSSLNFCVMAAEEEENGIQGISANRTNLLFGDFCKGEGCTSLQVHIVREGERCQRC